MNYHCGLLDPEPLKSRTLNYILRTRSLLALPPDILRELQIWLATPGFTTAYQSHQFQHNRLTLDKLMTSDPEVLQLGRDNWTSASRGDAVTLSRIRPGTGHIPTISRAYMIEDLSRGLTQVQVAEDYRVSADTVLKIRRRGLQLDSL